MSDFWFYVIGYGSAVGLIFIVVAVIACLVAMFKYPR